MKITCFATFMLLHGSQAFAPQQTTRTAKSPVVLNERKETDGWFGPAAAAIAGWTLAAQVAMAAGSPMAVTQQYGKYDEYT